MKGIRRSLNKDRIGAPSSSASASILPGTSSSRPASKTSAPPTFAARPSAAPAPPKRVIRATAAYRARSPQELSFEEGDFFHVVSDEGGDEWFDAANPMTGARGLVPADRFQVLGRNARETAMQGPQVKKTSMESNSSGGGSGGGGGSGPAGGGAGGGWKAGAPAGVAAYAPIQQNVSSAAPSPMNGRPPSASAPKHQPLYGVVQYDFVAERADELDAKRGEPIIVIAQSNHEWFVAKPIGRLGGPGLIPVAFVEIQDMTTGKPVENVEELIRSAVVPKVEEWKKMTAEYKSASIPLGRFDFGSSAAAAASAPASSSALPSASQQAHQSLSSYDQSHVYSHSGQPLSPVDSTRPEDEEGDAYDVRYSYSRERRQYGLVTSASVESFHQEEGSFWFHLRAFFSTGASLVLYRLYQDFYDFQIALMDEFPVEAGRMPGDDGRPAERILPMMPGPTEYEDEVVCAQRVHDLSIYLADLCALPEHIRGSGLMYEFLVPRAGDVEVSPGNVPIEDEASPAPSHGGLENQYGELVDYLDQMDGGGGAAGEGQRQSVGGGDVADQMGQMSLNGGAGYGHDEQHQVHDGESQRSYHETYYPQSPPLSQEPLPSPSAAATAAAAPMGTANQNVPFIKIKIFHRNTDDLIAIRVPPTVSHAALLDKVRERLGSDVGNLRYREEVGSASGPPGGGGQVVMAGGARLIGINTDEDLERWVRSGLRLVLYAD
ncbi:hypothetical protein JCM5296_003370 [Sporobolomyces johnsonii]